MCKFPVTDDWYQILVRLVPNYGTSFCSVLPALEVNAPHDMTQTQPTVGHFGGGHQ